ncbi:hypothetical protein C2G38_1048865 [Gigaspora rosea]|uniref:Uncharacterized protein n=1 Tax=Gigaspora rosea TaxID=44941 RepID=A0A397VJB4_9GLOM|nr:hypothetical protein C2G38_1048865 [Gigaspora rosea]
MPTFGSFNNARNISSHNKKQSNLRKNLYHRYDHQNISDKARKEMVQTYNSSRKYSTKSIKETPQPSEELVIQEDDDDIYQDCEKENEKNKENMKEIKNIDLENIDVLQFVRRQPTFQRARREKATSIFVAKFDHKITSTDSTPIAPIRV